MFRLAIFLLAGVTICLPLIIRLTTRVLPTLRLRRAYSWLPVLAGVLIVVSTYLPSVHISSQTSTFQQHFVGGGMYSAVLYIYFMQLLNWRVHWLVAVFSLFAWVSAFGVANKLGEFALVELHLANIDTADADWDLLANTVGGFVGYALIYAPSRLGVARK
jgi:hypothetical protein